MNEILVESEKVSQETLLSRIKAPFKIRKYLKSTELFIHYDSEITDNKSILNIPLTSLILSLAWLTDSNIKVDELDRNYYEHMYLLRNELNNIFHHRPFKTEILANNLTENHIGVKDTALLFSGGVDSMYSLLTNINRNPLLAMIWGIDMHVYPQHSEHWTELANYYSAWAQSLGTKLTMIKTNTSSILDHRRIEHDYHRELCSGWIGMKLTHSLRLVPLLAPLSIGRFNECLIAASIDHNFPFNEWPIGTIPNTDEKIVWADLITIHDGFIPRSDKVKLIAESIDEFNVKLKVCTRPQFNCNSCSKCYRTIISLLLVGVDPNSCGFNVTEKTFEDMKKHFMNSKYSVIEVPHYLKPMQAMVDKGEQSIVPGSKEFLDWFKSFDFDSKIHSNWKLRKIYNKLPYSMAYTYSKLLRKLGENIHPTSYVEACTEKNVNKHFKVQTGIAYVRNFTQIQKLPRAPKISSEK